MRIPRILLMALAMFGLFWGVWAGLLRLGWALPWSQPMLPMAHGPLMVSGFLGTLISLERAVALERRWAYLAPALTGLGGVMLVLHRETPMGLALITLGSLGLVAIFGHVLRRQMASFTIVMALGALAWFLGNLFWLGKAAFNWGLPMHQIMPWWIGFLLLTIAGERLELSRVARLPAYTRTLFAILTGLLLASLILSAITYDPGARLLGLSLLALALWLLRYDLARWTIRQTGLTRFMAVCLLSGYFWLGVSGALMLWYGGLAAGPRYDAALHAFFLGFVFAMIFGHAPIIFPGILKIPITYRPIFYSHLLLLHATLLLRIVSDLIFWLPGRQWGGMLNGLVLLLFLLNTIYSTGILERVRGYFVLVKE